MLPSRKCSSVPTLSEWAVLSDFLLKSTVWKGVGGEKPDNYDLGQAVKVNIKSDLYSALDRRQ